MSEESKAIEHLAEAMLQMAEEIKELRLDLKHNWLKINVQGQVSDLGEVRYDTKNR